jgi:hypothetical protein
MHEVELTGIDGSNLLGFLAALGVLRVLSSKVPEVRMSWRENSWWTPLLHSDLHDSEAVLTTVAPLVCGPSTLNEACRIGTDLRFSRQEFRKILHDCGSDPARAGFLCALGSDAFGNGKEDQISDTEFRTMSGAGHQHFLGTMAELADTTQLDHVRRALFEPWDYADGRPSLRWDPADYRPHALRSEDPSGDPVRTMRGANRLALEALPLFPTAPAGRQLRTAGFMFRDGAIEITWPIWTEALDLDTVRSLLTLRDLQDSRTEMLERRGIAEAFRATRFTEGKFRNFSPGRSIM